MVSFCLGIRLREGGFVNGQFGRVVSMTMKVAIKIRIKIKSKSKSKRQRQTGG